MEDDHIMIDEFARHSSQAFFGVYDGHGGREAVDFVLRSFHEVRVSCIPLFLPTYIPCLIADT
jgi:serine/threonine protein phosphatase PrpC